ncbi:MAG: DUF3047 domain-containing protein [Lysobacteraceae bacterium]
MSRSALALLLSASAPLAAAQSLGPTPFSAGPLAGTAPPGWIVERPTDTEHATFYDLVLDGAMHGVQPAAGKRGKPRVVADPGKVPATIVLRGRADGATATLRHGLFADPRQTPILRWRWRTTRALDMPDPPPRKPVDDAAAKLCVFFARKEETMTLKERGLRKFELARSGRNGPTAALCYVWDGSAPPDSVREDLSGPFLKTIVATAGHADENRWVSPQRDIAVDYQRAFGEPAPRVTGVSVTVDTDATGENVTTWFGDIHFDARATR